tara:strand:- start:281 stop:469 length:189 start_codon:yes stop_codon:yes gene_type:complete
MKKNANGSYSPRTAISTSNPQAKEDGDWWDEVCKAHGEENHWPKPSKKKKKIFIPKVNKTDI